jgi:hypothetical protein
METIIQFFLDCLQVTGGDLVPSKCAWYLISHRWKDGIPRLLQLNPTHHVIEIVSMSTGTVTTAGIKRKAPEEGHITLSFHLTGDETSTAHEKVMTDKAVLYGKAITHSIAAPIHLTGCTECFVMFVFVILNCLAV